MTTDQYQQGYFDGVSAALEEILMTIARLERDDAPPTLQSLRELKTRVDVLLHMGPAV